MLATLTNYECEQLINQMVEAALFTGSALEMPDELGQHLDMHMFLFDKYSMSDKPGGMAYSNFLLYPNEEEIIANCTFEEAWQSGTVEVFLDGNDHNKYHFECKLDDKGHMVATPVVSQSV